MSPPHSTPLARVIAATSALDAPETTGTVKNRRRGICGVAVLTLLLSAAVVQAGVAITRVVNGSSAPVLDSSFGTMDLAFNLGQTGGGTVVRDGITFTNNGVIGTTSVAYGTVSGITVGSFAASGVTINNADLGGDTLYNTETYTANNNPMTLVLTGLNPSKAYRIQVMHGEPRNLTYNNGAITATDSLANVATGSLTFGPSGSANQYALVTIEVSGSTSLSYFMPSAGRGPSFSGVVIHSQVIVPAPVLSAPSTQNLAATSVSAGTVCRGVTVTNTGNAVLTLGALSFPVADSAFSNLVAPSGGTLDPGESGNITFSVTATAPGRLSG